ncbi:MAG TPA: hypothetical protein PK397_11595, partial [Ignavibacteriaceae bacterium]|nr:hypothetical protein [Ignavibacteriaceae bacterium]
MAKAISLISMVTGTIGIFIGFYLLDNHPEIALKIVTVTTVGIVGLLAFIRHVIFHKSDSKRLGWETDRPDWMFEVGFANLAFGAIGFIAAFTDWGTQPQILTLLGYSIYLYQAALLHLYRYIVTEKK